MTPRSIWRVAAVAAALLGGVHVMAQGSWTPGARIEAQSADATTNTLALVAGDTPGTYMVEGANAMLSIGVLPKTAERRLALEGTGGEGTHGLSVPQLPGIEITVAPADAETIAVEFKSRESASALIAASLTSPEGYTTATVSMLLQPPGFTFQSTGVPRSLQIEGTTPLRRRVPTGAEVISTLTAEKPVKVMVRRTPLGS